MKRESVLRFFASRTLLLLTALAFVPATAGAAAAAPGDRGSLDQKTLRAAVDRAAPSVVRIETVGGMERLGRVLFGTGPTTGLILGADGTIVSSAFNFLHRPASILVQLADGTRKAARLVATDHNRMIALLKIETDKPLPVPEIAAPSEFRVGQWTIAMGRAFEGDSPNLAVGVLSATNRIWGKAIQTDAAVSPNNYGGPLIDLYGRVLGVLVPLSPTETSELAGVEWYDSGIGFAIPAQAILDLLPRLRQGKDLWPGFTGINIPLQTLYTADATIPRVRPRSPAYQAGLRAGDRIVAVDGAKVELAVQVKQEISRRYAGDKIHLIFMRGSERIERDVELVPRLEPYQAPFLGILPMRHAAQRQENKDAGVTVRFVYPNGPAAKAGIQPGDVLASAGGKPVQSVSQLRSRLLELQPGDALALEVRHGDQSRKAEVRLGDVPDIVPTGPIPPAYASGQPAPAKRPKVGAIRLDASEGNEGIWAYVPENYNPGRPCGVVVWLPPPGAVKPEAIQSLWKGPCDRDGLIVVAPQSSTSVRWQPREAKVAPSLVAQLAGQYAIDPCRVVVCGRQSGGTVALTAGFRYPQVVCGAVAIDAPAEGRIPETDPSHRLAIFLATAAKSRATGLIRETISQLRQMRYPVTIKDLGSEPRDLNAEDMAELARWIDTLDRI